MTNELLPLRFAVVGAGAISYAHFRAIRSLSGKATLAAVVDIDPAPLSRATTEFGVPGFESLEALLNTGGVDVVCICTPPNVHADLAVLAMGAGVHVIVEKPADVGVPETERILAAAKETGRRATVISQHRFDKSSLVVKDATEKGRLGRITRASAQVRWWRPQEYFEVVPWRASQAVTGGGALMSQSIHTLDLMLWMLSPVREVFAYADTLVHEIEIEDTLAAVLKFENGAIGVMEASIGTYPGLSARLEIAGDRGTAVIDGDRLAYFHAAEPGEATGLYGAFGDTNRASLELSEDEGSGVNQDPSQLMTAHASQIEDFIDAIREERAPKISLEETLKTMRVIEAIHTSVRTGKAVTL